LPCGWLYAFVLAAVGTGNVVTGAGILLAFWLGTLPALIGIGSVAQLLGQRARRLLPNLSALCLLVIGIGSVWSRYETAEQILPLTPSAWANETKDGADNAAAGANGANDTLPPCHRH
jgi:sulfite exporter TauE/SafE